MQRTRLTDADLGHLATMLAAMRAVPGHVANPTEDGVALLRRVADRPLQRLLYRRCLRNGARLLVQEIDGRNLGSIPDPATGERARFKAVVGTLTRLATGQRGFWEREEWWCLTVAEWHRYADRERARHARSAQRLRQIERIDRIIAACPTAVRVEDAFRAAGRDPRSFQVV